MVTIHGTDDAPVAVADAGRDRGRDHGGHERDRNVLANDSDVDTPQPSW